MLCCCHIIKLVAAYVCVFVLTTAQSVLGISCVWVSHTHADHYCGLPTLLRLYNALSNDVRTIRGYVFCACLRLNALKGLACLVGVSAAGSHSSPCLRSGADIADVPCFIPKFHFISMFFMHACLRYCLYAAWLCAHRDWSSTFGDATKQFCSCC